MPPRGTCLAALAALAAVTPLAACGDDARYQFDGLVELTGYSPFRSPCNGPAQDGIERTGMEVEPSLAIDPTDGAHLVAGWQQDRWSNGGSNGTVTGVSFDGGAHWALAEPRFSRCAGGDYERASDPWLAVAADGTPYAIAISFDGSTARSGVLAASSHDGGRSWDDPIVLRADDDPDVFNDKEAITADPRDAGRVYAVWDRLTGLTHPDQPIGTGPTWLARTTGGIWAPARPIYDPGADAQTIGNVIAVLPDGTLVDAFDVIRDESTPNPTSDIAVIRSSDGGDTWSAAIEVAPLGAVGVPGLRTGGGLPAIAVDPGTGALYLAWEDARFSGGQHDGIAIARSIDGGVTWSAPVQANGDPTAPAFTPTLAAARGTVGLLYYDLRAAPRVVAWLATSRDGGATWDDEPVSSEADLRPARLAGKTAFLGDYEGLVARGDRFVPLFAVPFASADPTDIFVRP